MTSAEKKSFRSKIVWKNFRNDEIKIRGSKCELCGKTFSSKDLDLHHLFPEFYTDLTPSKFKLLCTEDHDDVERWAKKVAAHNSGHTQIPNFSALMSWIGEFLPAQESTAKKYIAMTIAESKKKKVDNITITVL